MTLRDILKQVLTKLNIPEGNKGIENLIIRSINKAYIEIAEKSPIVSEYDYYALSKVLELPEDFLVPLSLSHSELGYLKSPSLFNIVGNSIILNNDVVNSSSNGSVHLIYGMVPTLLSNDTDVPLINIRYHNALFLYAMYIASEDSSEASRYFEEYINVINNIPPIASTTDDVNYVNDIKNVTGW